MKFKEKDEVRIHDGASARDGIVLRAPGDAYLVDTDHGWIWCGEDQVFERGGESAPAEAPIAVEANDAGEAGPAAEAGSDAPAAKPKKAKKAK